MKVVAQLILSYCCIGFAFWAGYLIHKDYLGLSLGITIILLCIASLGVLILLITKYRDAILPLVPLIIFIAASGFTLCSFAGVEPFFSIKNDILFEPKIASVQSIGVTNHGGYSLQVELKPYRAAQSEHLYRVELYEKNTFRDEATVIWYEPEINVVKPKLVYFSISEIEYSAYRDADISGIFKIRVTP